MFCPHCGQELPPNCQHRVTYVDSEGTVRCLLCLAVVRYQSPTAVSSVWDVKSAKPEE